jgi:hypothetical protein
VVDAFAIETASFRTLLAAPEFPALSHLFSALRGVAGTATAVREFPSALRALLDAGPDPEAMAAAARRALDRGLVIDPGAADVASVLAAGFPPWLGGVIHHPPDRI